MMATALNMLLWSGAYATRNSNITGIELYADSSLGRVHFSLNKSLTGTSERKWLILHFQPPKTQEGTEQFSQIYII